LGEVIGSVVAGRFRIDHLIVAAIAACARSFAIAAGAPCAEPA